MIVIRGRSGVSLNPQKLGGFSFNQRCTIKYELETLFCVGIQEKVVGT